MPRKKRPPKSLYADLFTEHELAELARTADNPLLSDEISLLRMLIRRLAAQVLDSLAEERAPGDKIKAVRELTEVLLSMLKARDQLSPRAEDNLAEAMRQVIAELEAAEDAGNETLSAASKRRSRYQELAERLDAQGCAFGQVTRELAVTTREDYARLEAKINVILIGILASPFAAAFLNGLLRFLP